MKDLYIVFDYISGLEMTAKVVREYNGEYNFNKNRVYYTVELKDGSRAKYPADCCIKCYYFK